MLSNIDIGVRNTTESPEVPALIKCDASIRLSIYSIYTRSLRSFRSRVPFQHRPRHTALVVVARPLSSLADGGGSTSSQASRGRGAATRRCDPRARASGARVRHGPSHAAPPRLPVSQKGGASAGAPLPTGARACPSVQRGAARGGALAGRRAGAGPASPRLSFRPAACRPASPTSTSNE